MVMNNKHQSRKNEATQMNGIRHEQANFIRDRKESQNVTKKCFINICFINL